MDHRTILLCAEEYPVLLKDRTLYVGYERFGTRQYVTDICQFALGNEVSYGVLYGLGNYIADSLEHEAEEELPELSEAFALLTGENRIYLDLEYPCFIEPYASADIIKAVKAVSVAYVEYLVGYSDEGAEIIDYANLDAFLAEFAREPYDKSDLDGISFFTGGAENSLIWETEDAVFYLSRDFIDAVEVICGSPTYAPYSFIGNYGQLRQITVDYQLQAKRMQEILSPYLEQKPLPTQVFIRKRESLMGYAGKYYSSSRTIELQTACPWMHEYTHYLTYIIAGKSEPWCHEVIAAYFTYIVAENEQLNYIHHFEDVVNDKLEVAVASEEKLSNNLGHEFSWYNTNDVMHYVDAISLEYIDCNNIRDLRYESGASFMNYLVKKYGEKDALESVLYNDVKVLRETSWSKVFSDWNSYLLEESL